MKHYDYLPPIPTIDRVRSAILKFDGENLHIEQALGTLFRHYPRNENPSEVLLKVVTLNALYSTRIPMYSTVVPNVWDVAQHIYARASDIDSALKSGLPEIVDTIRQITVSGKNNHNYFSFATRYCSWHNWDAYPIWDSHVENYFAYLKKANPTEWARFGGDFDNNSHSNYPAFRDLMTRFRDAYSFRSMSFKDTDKFLWQYGKRSPVMVAALG